MKQITINIPDDVFAEITALCPDYGVAGATELLKVYIKVLVAGKRREALLKKAAIVAVGDVDLP